jgi:hypothetical protein
MRRILFAAAAGLVLQAQVPDLKLLNIIKTFDFVRGVTHLALDIRQDWKPKPERQVWVDPRRDNPEQWKAFLASHHSTRKFGKDATPGAVVEVWGDASWARQDEFKAFSRFHQPAFRSAFNVGLSASVGADHLANLMGGDPSARPPLIWSPVWFNATNPWARDSRRLRRGLDTP